MSFIFNSPFTRWLSRLALALVALALLLVAIGTIFEMISRQRAEERFPARGKLVDIGGRKMHLDCRGQGWPTIVLEAGFSSNGSVDWLPVQDALANITRTCSYDRAGIMWSDAKSSPQNGVAVAEDLHAALSIGGERGPFILVAHSLGGAYSLIYTRKYPGDVAGLVLVDASHPDQSARMKQAGIGMKDPEGSRFMDMLAVMRWTGLPRLMMRSGNSGAPLEVRERARAYAGISIAGTASEAAGFSETMREARESRDLGDRPLMVLTAMKPLSKRELRAVGASQDQGAIAKRIWSDLHDEEMTWSSRGAQQTLPDSSHYIAWDRPDAVISAVRQVVGTVRAERR